MDLRHFETVVARLDGSVVESIELTLVQMTELDADAAPLRLPDEQAAATMATATALADALDSSMASGEPEVIGAQAEAAEASQAVVERQVDPSPSGPLGPIGMSNEGESVESIELIAAGPDEG
jgi:hypothetical protein